MQSVIWNENAEYKCSNNVLEIQMLESDHTI